MNSLISKPLLAILYITLATSVVVSQRVTIADSSASLEDGLLPETPAATARHEQEPDHVISADLSPWTRRIFATRANAIASKPVIAAPLIALAPPPPPTPIIVQAPPPIVAPPVPFSYLGRMIDGNKTRLFLGVGESVKVVSIGAPIDNEWLLRGINSHSVQLDYLPNHTSTEIPLSP